MIRTLIVDDERLARAELRRLLASHPDVTLIGEAANGPEGRALLESERPDLVLIDIEMPGETGFDMLLKARGDLPRVIFTTAFDEFALRAFEFSALDYLLKPVDADRLAQSLERVRLQQTPPPVEGDEATDGDDDDEEQDETEGRHASDDPNALRRLTESDQVFIKDNDKCYFIRLGQVRLFESLGNYVRLHFDGGKPLILRSLNALEARLDPQVYFRANRRQIVNLRKVLSVEPYFSGSLLLKLEGGDRVEVSRRQTARFKEVLSL